MYNNILGLIIMYSNILGLELDDNMNHVAW